MSNESSRGRNKKFDIFSPDLSSEEVLDSLYPKNNKLQYPILYTDTEDEDAKRKEEEKEQALYDWIENIKNKNALEVPLDPETFYKKFGIIRHPDTRKLVEQLTPYQYDVWLLMLKYKYLLVIKSQKVGLSTSALIADFQRTILPTDNPISCRGYDVLIIAQSIEAARQHLYTLRRMIAESPMYSDYLITKPPRWLAKDETTKVN